MGAVTAVPLGRPARRAASARRLFGVQAVLGVLVAGLLVLSLSLVLVGTPAAVEVVSANLLGVPRGADEITLANPKVVVLPAEPGRPVDVPADPYAPEAVVEIGRFRIPKLGVDQKLMHGVTLNNIDQGPSHWPGTPYPGQQGNVVIAGHRVTHSKPMRNVDQLVPGDQVIVSARGIEATYEVVETFIVFPSQTSIVDATAEPILTMFGCHPPHSARQRIVVRSRLVGSRPVDPSAA